MLDSIQFCALKMEELPERSEFRRTQRERERERRRVRDRERRLSMSLEQREKHLARRRRNYQLRRMRAGNLRIDQSLQHQAEISIAELDRNQNGFTLIGFNHEQEPRNPECIKSLGSESVDIEAESLRGRGRVRLSHIRRVARSINNHSSSEYTGIHQILAKVNKMEESTSNDMQIGECDPNRSSKALRLNSVKRLARMIKCGVKKASVDPENQTSIAG